TVVHQGLDWQIAHGRGGRHGQGSVHVGGNSLGHTAKTNPFVFFSCLDIFFLLFARSNRWLGGNGVRSGFSAANFWFWWFGPVCRGWLSRSFCCRLRSGGCRCCSLFLC